MTEAKTRPKNKDLSKVSSIQNRFYAANSIKSCANKIDLDSLKRVGSLEDCQLLPAVGDYWVDRDIPATSRCGDLFGAASTTAFLRSLASRFCGSARLTCLLCFLASVSGLPCCFFHALLFLIGGNSNSAATRTLEVMLLI